MATDLDRFARLATFAENILAEVKASGLLKKRRVRRKVNNPRRKKTAATEKKSPPFKGPSRRGKKHPIASVPD